MEDLLSILLVGEVSVEVLKMFLLKKLEIFLKNKVLTKALNCGMDGRMYVYTYPKALYCFDVVYGKGCIF